MIRSDDNTNPAERSDKRSGKCWHREPGAQAIRLETADNGTFLFPYQHLVFAHLSDAGDGDGGGVLTLGFPSHKAAIHGKRLHLILKSLADLSVAWVSVLPPRYADMRADGSAVVTKIEVCSTDENVSE